MDNLLKICLNIFKWVGGSSGQAEDPMARLEDRGRTVKKFIMPAPLGKEWKEFVATWIFEVRWDKVDDEDFPMPTGCIPIDFEVSFQRMVGCSQQCPAYRHEGRIVVELPFGLGTEGYRIRFKKALEVLFQAIDGGYNHDEGLARRPAMHDFYFKAGLVRLITLATIGVPVNAETLKSHFYGTVANLTFQIKMTQAK